MKWPLMALVRAYQLLISPLLGPTCRYYPSCSSYALEALRVHGAIKGTWLAVRRLLSCHPWSPGGVDHVPPRGERRGWQPSPALDERDPDLRPAAAGGPLSQGENP